MHTPHTVSPGLLKSACVSVATCAPAGTPRGPALPTDLPSLSYVSDTTSQDLCEDRPPVRPPSDVLQAVHPGVLDAVVKIYVTHCEPNYGLPWQMSRQTYTTSSGFAIENNRLLTNAHSIMHHTVVRVKKRTSDTKYIANVLAVGEECDLALLSVPDDDFWTDIIPLKFRPLPRLQEAVVVVGYPFGGENISVTAGVVSRIELQEYSPASHLLSIQIDAAINPGNSGGPALNHQNEVVGIAFQTLRNDESENIGYLIAQSVVDHFLNDYIRHGRYTGFCHCGFDWQCLENPALRSYMRMKAHQTGVLVRKVYDTSHARHVLLNDDIVMSIDGLDISNAGTVPYDSGERISFHYIVTTKFTGDEICLDVLRNGVCIRITYQLSDCNAHLLAPVHVGDERSDYFMIGGLVFVTLTEPYLYTEYGPKWRRRAPVNLQKICDTGRKRKSQEQVVILTQVLNSGINVDYEHIVDEIVRRCNGVDIVNLTQLAAIVDRCSDRFLRFDLEDQIVVLDRLEALKADASILKMHHIPTCRSFAHGDVKSIPI